MKRLSEVGLDEQLTAEQGLYIRARAVEAARRTMVGRPLFGTAIRKIDSGAQTYGYDVLTNPSDASLDFAWPGRMSLDAVNLARQTVAIPILHKEFEISRLDLMSSRMTGTPLNTTTAEAAAYKVSLLEDLLLIDGYTNNGTDYDIRGLFRAAGNAKDGETWATATNIPAAINDAIKLLMDDNIMPPYNLVLNPQEYNRASVFISNTAVSYLQWIKEQLQGGSIYVTPAITAGKAMLVKANPEGAFEYVIAEDLTVETEQTSLKEGGNLFGRVYLRGLPVIYDANAICTIDCT